MTPAARRVRSWAQARLVYPLALRVLGQRGVFNHLRGLQELQWHSPEEVESYQSERLRRILLYALDRSPYYRDAGARAPEDMLAPPAEWLAGFPLLDRVDLASHPDRLRASGFEGRTTYKTTGGSTGRPVTVLKDAGAVAWERAASLLGHSWFGVDPGHRGVIFWGAPTTGRRRISARLADVAMNRRRLSAFGFDDASLERYWEACRRIRPDYCYGYVSMIEAFARYLERTGRDGTRLGLKAVITTSEALTEPQRTLLQGVFGAPVQNEYGCGEMGAVAYECPEGGLHVMASNAWLEVLRADGSQAQPGEPGEIVLTDLNNVAMPLIRYRIGDLAVRARGCACGRGLPRLERVWGRAYDFVEDRDGRRYHGEYFMYLFEDLRNRGLPVGQFQVTQLPDRSLEVALLVSEQEATALIDEVTRAFGRRLPGLEVRVDAVGVLEREPSGKTRVIRSLL